MDNKFYDSPNDSSSIHSDKKEKKLTKLEMISNSNYIFNNIIDSLNSEKQDIHKIKILIIAEQDLHYFAKEKKKYL
jgi:hypothetical protein